jgi:hypothetical protein
MWWTYASDEEEHISLWVLVGRFIERVSHLTCILYMFNTCIHDFRDFLYKFIRPNSGAIGVKERIRVLRETSELDVP